MTKYITLAEAVEEYGLEMILDDLIAGKRKAIGLKNDEGLPTAIPCEHFAIPHKKPNRMLTFFEGGELKWGHTASWLDLATSTIYDKFDSTPCPWWTEIQVEGEVTPRIPLPKMDGGTPTKEAAIWGLKHLYGERGYPTSLSMDRIAELVNSALQDKAPLRFKGISKNSSCR